MKFEDILLINEGVDRIAFLASWVQHLYRKEDSLPVLVGGAAVELFTGGAYVTGDQDFVGDVPSHVRHCLKENGFKKQGRHWIHEEGEIFLEFPGTAISEPDEKVILRRGDIEVITISPESLILDRLRSLVYWRYKEDGLNAFLLVQAQKHAISPDRVRAIEKDREVLEAFEKLWRLAGATERKQNDRAIVDWLEQYL